MTHYYVWGNDSPLSKGLQSDEAPVFHLMTSDPAIIVVKAGNPSSIILHDPVLEQIHALCKLGYTPPAFKSGIRTDWTMVHVDNPIAFPKAGILHKKVVSYGQQTTGYLDITAGLTDQEIVTLMQYGYFAEEGADMYSWATEVLEMTTRYLENAIADRQADDILNGENHGAVR